MRALLSSLFLVTLVAVASGLGTACDPFDPDLGAKPFLCGTDDPKCPDGYEAVNVTTIRCECHKTAAPSGGGSCDNFASDSTEPNDSTDMATPTAIGPSTTTSYDGISICPASDEDYFAMQIAKVGTIIQVVVTFDSGAAAPTVDILSPSGTTVSPTLTPISGKITATFTSRVTGEHYALVKAGATLEPVNYSINLKITPPSN